VIQRRPAPHARTPRSKSSNQRPRPQTSSDTQAPTHLADVSTSAVHNTERDCARHQAHAQQGGEADHPLGARAPLIGVAAACGMQPRHGAVGGVQWAVSPCDCAVPRCTLLMSQARPLPTPAGCRRACGGERDSKSKPLTHTSPHIWRWSCFVVVQMERDNLKSERIPSNRVSIPPVPS